MQQKFKCMVWKKTLESTKISSKSYSVITFDKINIFNNMNIRQVLYVLELIGIFTCTWPINPNISKRRIIFRNILWTFSILNVILLMTSLMLAVVYFRSDILMSMKTASEMAALLEVVLDLILCKWNNSELQVLIEEVKSFLEIANEYEIKILQGYINRYKKFFSTVSMGYISTAISFSLMPLFSAQELPADGWLPFSIEPFGIYCIVYVNHVYCILQTAFCIFVDFTIVILFSFPAAKLDVLRSKLRHVNNYDMLVSCIKEHQKIIGFVEDTKATVETLLFKTNVTMGSTMMCGAFPLLNNQSLAAISQFLPLVLSGILHLYVIAWPADDLRESSVQFTNSISDIQWLGQPNKMKSCVIFMMMRSQKAFLIRMSNLLPPLSLEYCSNFITTVSSYFMAMRTMIES
ncbi:uncharacterized protein LOC122713427 [Apis laboriosa]|uniref:uncharacterized protein LOC122713427 n=1 Tax=Apis laboriosa TaxID=183418 RepID=UPI001CC4BD83|nr:uncharacterized protein LOC122713427 [Apis laboriosa]